ncbi:hypothetical protein MMC13_007184 [Lambiella insularis]|nr:hypothetical protein [Lambiella insularis]
MNQSATTTWSPMISAPDDDFANFLEFGELHLNFPTFDPEAPDGASGPQTSLDELDTSMDAGLGMMALKPGPMEQQIDSSMASMPSSASDVPGASEPLMEMNLQAQLFLQQQMHYHQERLIQGHYQRPGMIPATPNSLDMHGPPRSYPHMDSQSRAMYEQYARSQQDQMAFTPLVSPAVTPVEAQFRVQDYAIPGEYFSPLSSPALEGQNRPVQRSVYGAVQRSDASATVSPIEMLVDQGSNTFGANGAVLRKSKRKSISTSTRPLARSVRQSPAMKPQTRRKQPSSTVIPPREVAEVIADARRSKQTRPPQSSNGKLAQPYGQDSSEADSVSPEPLSEILMPPPATPRPASVGRSPRLQARGSQSAPMRPLPEIPATPASLMNIRKDATNGARDLQDLKQSNSRAEAEMEQIMEGIIIPEASMVSKRSLPALDTTNLGDDQETPTLVAKKSMTSASTPASYAVPPSPRSASTVASPGGSISGKRTDGKAGGRASKKRNSLTSSQVSPAIRPRISPSIKPLLPEGTTINAETSALLLASKSNYQNILEGTHLPGVSYPEALSTNLTSKRTSHKIAEQGRRNRINNALQEIASLLPASTPLMQGVSGASSGDGDTGLGNLLYGTAAQQSNSKASTVEMAIEYIKSLQSELKDVRGRLEVAEKKLDEGITAAAVKA